MLREPVKGTRRHLGSNLCSAVYLSLAAIASCDCLKRHTELMAGKWIFLTILEAQSSKIIFPWDHVKVLGDWFLLKIQGNILFTPCLFQFLGAQVHPGRRHIRVYSGKQVYWGSKPYNASCSALLLLSAPLLLLLLF